MVRVMKKKVFVISVTLLITISALGCSSKADQTEDVLKTTTVKEQQKITRFIDDTVEVNTSEVITQETTTQEETITQKQIETSITTIGQTTTTKESTTQKQTTTSNMTQQKTTTRQETTTQKTTTPATTAKEVATEEQTTAAPVVGKNTIDFSKAKEAFKNYVAVSYNNVSGYDAIVLNNTPVLFVVLNNGDSRLLSYYNNSVVDSAFEYDYFEYNYNNDTSISFNMGAGNDTQGYSIDFIYKLDNTGHIKLDAKYTYKYKDAEHNYYKEINGIESSISNTEYKNTLVDNGIYGKFNVDFFTLTGGCGTIDGAFVILESKIK